MKCPKCGFTSFDHLESCKKCNNDLTGHKAKFGLRRLFFPVRHSEPAFETEQERPFEEPASASDPTEFDFDFMSEQEAAIDDLSDLSLDNLSDGEVSLETDEIFLQGETEPAPASVTAGPIEEEFCDTGTEPTGRGFAWDDSGDGSDDLSDPLPDADFSFVEAVCDEEAEGEDGGPRGEPEDQYAGSSPDDNLATLFLDSFDETVDTGDFPTGVLPSSNDLPALGNDLFEATSLTIPEMKVTEVFPPEDSADSAEEEPAVSFAPNNDPWENVEDEALSGPDEDTVPPLTARFGAGVADLLLLGLIFVLFLAAGEIALSRGQGGAIFPTVAKLLDLAIPYFLVLFTVFFGYFTLFHFLIGQTPGKMIFRLRVEGEQGEALLFSQAFLRSVGGLLSLLPAGLGYLRIALDRERRGWNDRLANSRVVRASGCRNLAETAEGRLAEEA